MLPPICLEWPSTVGQFLHIAPLNNINKSPKTLKTNIPVRMNMCKTCRLWRRRKGFVYYLKWLNFFLCILVSLTLIVSSNMNRFLVGLWVIPDGNEAGVEMWSTSSPLCFSVVSLPLPIPLSHSSVPLNHIYFHFHLHHHIIKHPRLHFLKWSQSHSASCVRLALVIPPDKLVCWHTVKNELHSVNAQILMWGTPGGDGGSIKTQ